MLIEKVNDINFLELHVNSKLDSSSYINVLDIKRKHELLVLQQSFPVHILLSS